MGWMFACCGEHCPGQPAPHPSRRRPGAAARWGGALAWQRRPVPPGAGPGHWGWGGVACVGTGAPLSRWMVPATAGHQGRVPHPQPAPRGSPVPPRPPRRPRPRSRPRPRPSSRPAGCGPAGKAVVRVARAATLLLEPHPQRGRAGRCAGGGPPQRINLTSKRQFTCRRPPPQVGQRGSSPQTRPSQWDTCATSCLTPNGGSAGQRLRRGLQGREPCRVVISRSKTHL